MTFERERIRHPTAIRRVTVSYVQQLVPSMVRVSVTGPELEGFLSEGPADHVKVFFPDPATGTLTAPTVTEDGVQRPTDGVVLSRDFTPLNFRPGGPPELDLDFVLHGDTGPASAWAARAQVGDQLAIAGPKGSKLVPQGIDELLLIADETALPAATRWLDAVGDDIRVTAILEVADDSVDAYLPPQLASRASIEWLYREDGPGQLDEALRSVGPIGENTFAFLAGEATSLVPLRRYLRRDLGLPKEQVSVHGYWKRGIVNLDHHAPVDPTDPD